MSRSCFALVFFSFFFLALQSFALAATQDDTSKLIEYLLQQKASQSLKLNEIKTTQTPENLADYGKRKQQIEAFFAVNTLKIANLKNLLTELNKDKQSLSQQLKELQQKTPLNETKGYVVQEKINKLTALLEVNEKAIDLVASNLDLAQRLDGLHKEQLFNLKLWKAKFDLDEQVHTINLQLSDLQAKKAQIYQENIQLQDEQSVDTRPDFNIRFEAQLILNNQRAALIQTKISELELHKKQLRADYNLLKEGDIKALEFAIATYKKSLARLQEMAKELEEVQVLLHDEKLVLHDSEFKAEFSKIDNSIKTRSKELLDQINVDQKQLEILQRQLKQQLAVKQSLAEYHLSNWPGILVEFIKIPYKFYSYLKALAYKVLDSYVWQSKGAQLGFWAGLAAILLVAFSLNAFLTHIIQDKIRLRLAGHLYDWILVLFKRNIPQLSFIFGVVAIFYLNHISMGSYRLLFNLLLVWLAFRNLILLARLMLLERVSDASGKDVKLYYRLKRMFLAGGWVTGLMVFSHQYPLSLLMQDIFNRLFMLFILLLALVIWRSKDIIPYLLRPILKAKKRYVKRAVVLLINLIPITLFSTGVIGLVGYTSLAWVLSRYQAYFLLVITGYVLVKGLLNDLLELISEWMISSMRNGWLWIEVCLKPLDRILHILLTLLSILLLFQLFDWSADSWVMKNLKQIGSYPLINVSGIHITVISFTQFLILLFIFIWASKWTREFGYRWLYRKARDAGVRNSLSVFTQYGVIIIGTFITLRALGIDLSGMSMILGGLAVGMGFGLRDFASNIIGGIMLLIERPVREGDLITLGDYEGRVAHIGIRSMRVSSWDNMEVLIPNAETFNKPFTNWTHQDNIVRSVIPIKVSRNDDPVSIQQLILDVLAIIPEILSSPPPQVYLKHIDEALIEFEVRYYINVLENTRFEVRSKVLFAITAQFKAAGVEPPIPPLSIELKDKACGDSNPKDD